ncbi:MULTISPECIES: flagellar basal body L-ring protein FlgH [Thioalkalivibrio]|uniref:Flagellar L-ring protein n=1 Tax=Thioalkalivibrio halophilus TaxID=252474 RepID=A0A1V3A2D4_9GAMM|nr:MULTISPECIES: flagellar basal body L-ring protein FlgH [Thioalkalivibrio]OOC11496.1 flagellar basal body L-ring protein [Thioalkalivibrio halophilus]
MNRATLSLIRWLAPLALVLLGGCASMPHDTEAGDAPEYHAVQPPEPVPQAQNNGSIYQASHSHGLFTDPKAARVGDILTVVLAESTDAQKSSSTSTNKDSDLNLGTLEAFGGEATRGGRPLFGVSNNSSRGFDGGGDSSQSNQLEGEITVTVAEVLPNGNLVIQGEKWLGINQGEEYVRLRGIVRPQDVNADNTVLSGQVADARISYGGSGFIADSNTPGWITRFFNSPLWPF